MIQNKKHLFSGNAFSIIFLTAFLSVTALFPAKSNGEESAKIFQEDFENGLSNWYLENPEAIRLVNSGDSSHGKALELDPAGLTYALINGSEKWGAVRLEGEYYFPTSGNSYLGFIYNFNPSGDRVDFNSVYIKGNGSYLRVNPWRDGNASRLLYEEYKTNITGEDEVIPGVWQRFAVEIKGREIHFYVGNMSRPKLIFPFYERNEGLVGFKPRIAGAPAWIDNLSVTKIKDFSYNGSPIPNIVHEKNELITDWQVLGPLPGPSLSVERQNDPGAGAVEDDKFGVLEWQPFETDGRGTVITGRITEYMGDEPVAYFRTQIESPEARETILHFSSTDEIALFVNGRFLSFIYRQGYVSGPGYPWNAWYDFWKNPDHKGRRVAVPLEAGVNQIVVRVRNGQFASGGFFLVKEEVE